ncbi:orotidine-5'-phosphate decarboxylase [Oscillospiraceae bacterium MB08-C2-2]|nr:orotidine-5'-phosphate decarboxylase [Oscillospiraceae bacterium MB08-C2-2]
MKLIDRLHQRVMEKGHVCLGLDTDAAYLPEDFRKGFESDAAAVLAFNKEIIDSTHDIVAVYKVQIAYYEAMGLAGMETYAKTLAYLREKQAIIIADVKRGDIAKTAEMYAAAHFTGDFEADFITVSPYMGMDTLEPYFPYLATGEKGLFVLVATSNPGAPDIEGLIADDQPVYLTVGEKTAKLGEQFAGECGYSAIGGVVGCTNSQDTQRIRQRLPGMFFLIPGYGAQGGTASEIAHYLHKGSGGVVNSSRGILMSWKKPEHAGKSFAAAARDEAIAMRDDILFF